LQQLSFRLSIGWCFHNQTHILTNKTYLQNSGMDGDDSNHWQNLLSTNLPHSVVWAIHTMDSFVHTKP
jgi:hypothetical protein